MPIFFKSGDDFLDSNSSPKISIIITHSWPNYLKDCSVKKLEKILGDRSARNLRGHLVPSFHFTENCKWGQNLCPESQPRTTCLGAFTGQFRAGLNLREVVTPFLLFLVSHSSILKLELLLVETNYKVPPCLTYFLSLLTIPLCLLGSVIISSAHRCTSSSCLTFVILLVIPGESAPFPCLSVYSAVVDRVLCSVKPHFCRRAFPDCPALTDLRSLNFYGADSL